jgi:hypothetical protein
MGFDLNRTTLIANSGLAAMFASQFMKMGPTGTLQRYNQGQPMFRAGMTGTAAGVNIGTVNTWTPLIFGATNVNVNSCYSTATGRFTAPVDGVYLMAASTYVTGGATLGWYVQSLFFINGSATVRRLGGGLHRIHSHGEAAGHAGTTESFEIMSLLAGDYVQFYNYPGGYVSTWTPQYSRFEGYLLN